MHPEEENQTQVNQTEEADLNETLEGIDQTAESEVVAEPSDSIETLRAELEETKQNWARERADFSNYRKRMIEEMGKARTATVSNFVRSLIPVIDNLDLVLAAPAEDPAVKNFVIGVDMIRGEFLNILGREGIRPEVSAGGAFDPYLMEAVELEEIEGYEGEKVEHVYKKAYIQLTENGERQVLRPATVKVIRGKRAEADSDTSVNTPEVANGN